MSARIRHAAAPSAVLVTLLVMSAMIAPLVAQNPAPTFEVASIRQSTQTLMQAIERGINPTVQVLGSTEVSTIAGVIDYVSAQIGPEPVVDRTEWKEPFNARLEIARPTRPDIAAATVNGNVDLEALRRQTVDRLRAALDKVGLRLERTRASIPTWSCTAQNDCLPRTDQGTRLCGESATAPGW